jgi:hypothetical protein
MTGIGYVMLLDIMQSQACKCVKIQVDASGDENMVRYTGHVCQVSFTGD